MKLEQKILFILFLIISSSILSIHSRIKFSRHLSRLSKSLHKGGEPNKSNSNESEESSGVDEDFARLLKFEGDTGEPDVEDDDEESFGELRNRRSNSFNRRIIGNTGEPDVESDDDESLEKNQRNRSNSLNGSGSRVNTKNLA